MMNRRTLLALLSTLVMALVVSFGALGCKSKASLDADVDHLLVALATSDYDHFKADAHPSLAQEVPKAEFERMAAVLKGLGPVKSKTMNSIQVKAGAPTEGHYNMVFTNGTCNLDIKSLNGKLVAFRFSGPDVDRLSKGAR